jgi:hypothetical protein
MHNEVEYCPDGQFHQHFTSAFFVQNFVQSQTLSREKLLKRLLYKKLSRKMLMKLTPDGQSQMILGFSHFPIPLKKRLKNLE